MESFPPVRRRRAPRWWLHPTLLLILALGIGFRLWSMQRVDLNYDEIIQARVTLVEFGEISSFLQTVIPDVPVNYWLEWAVHRVLPQDWALRLPALLWGVLMIPLAWRAGRVLLGRRGSEIAALLVALSPFLIYSSHVMRQTSAQAFFSLAIPLAGFEFLRRPRLSRAVALAATVLLGLFSHLVLAGVVAALGGAAAFIWFLGLFLPGRRLWQSARVRLGPLLALEAICGVATLLFSLWLRLHPTTIIPRRGGPDWSFDVFKTPYFQFFGDTLFPARILLVLALVGLGWLAWRRPFGALLAVLVLLTWVAVVVAAIQRDYDFWARHVIHALPWILICAAAGVEAVRHFAAAAIPRRVLTPALLFGTAALMVPPAIRTPSSDWDYGPPLPMKRLSALVLDNFRADTRFLMSDYLYNPLEWFSQRHPGLEAHLWKTAGPPDGPRGLDFPLRVVSISRFPTREHIAGDGLRLGDLFISDQVFESTEDLGAFLLDFSFQAFADANSLSKHAQQQNFLTLATLWNVDTAPFLDKGPRTRDDYVEAMDLTVEAQTPLREKDWERARNLLMQAYEHDPYSKHTLGGLAHIAQSTENYEEAIGCWTEVNRILPSFQADWNLALLYHEIGRHVEALEAIRRAARYPLVYERFYTIYAQILESAGRSEDVDALELERSLREEFI